MDKNYIKSLFSITLVEENHANFVSVLNHEEHSKHSVLFKIKLHLFLPVRYWPIGRQGMVTLMFNLGAR